MTQYVLPRAALLLCAGLLLACSKVTQAPAAPSALPEPPVQITTDTPDQAIKSYWAVQDWARRKERAGMANSTARTDPESNAMREQISRVQDAAMTLDDAAPAVAVVDTYLRDIDRILVETETRAVIIAVIKNTTPIPAGADQGKWEMDQRQQGGRYKYIMAKGPQGWKVAELWVWDGIATGDWRKIRPYTSKPTVPHDTYSAA